MPEYLVKTMNNRNLVIEAEHLEIIRDGYHTTEYLFRKKDGKFAASVPAENVFAVVEEDSWKADFYNVDDWNDKEDDDSDDVCLDRRIKDVVNTDEFFDAVWDIVDAYHDDGDEQVAETPQQESSDPQPSSTGPEPGLTEAESKVLRWKSLEGSPTWGFVAEGKFVPFGDGAYGKKEVS